ncbi:MAG: acyl--CoA ligase [Halioglobus sp.]|nr:acyl--CoA ligase [Halioglobus sp.]
MYAELAKVRAELCAEGQLFEIEEVNVNGIPVKAWRHAPSSLREFWLQSAGHGDAVYLVYGDERWTYSEAHEQVNRIARWLVGAEVQPGDRVAIAMRNYPEWLLCYWATVSIGAVAVGVNAWWVPEELAYGLNDCTPKIIFCDRERLERFDTIRDEVPDMLVVGVRSDDNSGEYAIPWARVLQADATMPDVDIDPDEDACIFYTSGTTGHPKGAELTHRGCTNNIFTSLFANLSQLQALPAEEGEEFDAGVAQSVLLTTPLFHVTANNVVAHSNTMLGGKLVFMYKWDAGEALKLVEREQITAVSGVPVMSREMLSHADFETTDTSSLKSLGGGGAPVQPDLIEKIDQKANVVPSQGYGMTETCGLATFALGAFLLDRPDSCGPASPIIEMRIVNDAGVPLPAGERGEVLMRSSQVIKGYLNRDDATRETIVDGWLHSGDIGYLDRDGFLYIVDRAKDMVLRGGENVTCSEVETVLFQHPGVAEAAVFSVPDETLGEEVGAAVFPKDGTALSAEDLRAFSRGLLSAYKIPRYIWIMEKPLPRNASGKFLKKELQATLSIDNSA